MDLRTPACHGKASCDHQRAMPHVAPHMSISFVSADSRPSAPATADPPSFSRAFCLRQAMRVDHSAGGVVAGAGCEERMGMVGCEERMGMVGCHIHALLDFLDISCKCRKLAVERTVLASVNALFKHQLEAYMTVRKQEKAIKDAPVIQSSYRYHRRPGAADYSTLIATKKLSNCCSSLRLLPL